MNSLGPGLIDDVCKAAIAADLASIINDTDASTTVTISTPTGSSFDGASGLYSVNATDNTSVEVLLQTMGLREIETSAGLYQQGDQICRVLASDLTIEPTTDTSVIDTDASPQNTYAVVDARRDALDLHWRIILRLRA